MAKLVNGITHVCIKCTPEELPKVMNFYNEILGLTIDREWDGGIMLSAGNCIVEVFTDAENRLPTGAVRHFAFDVDSVDACVKAVSDAGYEVFTQPTDTVIASADPLPIRYAFCYGPVGEEVEFFEVR